MRALERYDWPGNVRELKNALERSLILARGEDLVPGDLPEEVVSGKPLVKKVEDGGETGMGETDFRDAKRKFEVAYLKRKLEEHRWN